MADGLDTLTGGVGSGCLCSVPLQDLQRKGPTRLFYSLVPNKEIFVSPRQEDAVSFIKIAKGAPDADKERGPTSRGRVHKAAERLSRFQVPRLTEAPSPPHPFGNSR